MPEKNRGNATLSIVMVVALIALFLIPMFVAPRTGVEGEEFGGTDGAATEILEEQGVEPWFEPLVNLDSGEIESGLFALQAAAGAGIVGFALGSLSGRSAAKRKSEAAADKTASP